MARPAQRLLASALLGALAATSALAIGSPTPAPAAVPAVRTAAAPAGAVLAPLSPNAPGAPVPTAAAVTTALSGPARVPALGNDLTGVVLDAASGTVLWSKSPDALRLVASTQKLLVAAAALTVLGPGSAPTTTVLAAGPVQGGVLHGDLVLRGGGDVLLAQTPGPGWPATASVDALAAQVAAAGVRTVTGAVVGDGRLFTGPAQAPGWRPTYVPQGNVAPVTALEVDHGRLGPTTIARSLDPAALAASDLRTQLRAHGVIVDGGVRDGATPAGAQQLAAVSGTPVGVEVQEMLENSDNDLAESLGRRVALALHLPATFAGAATAILQTLSRTGLPLSGTHLSDASGLSRDDGVAPGLVATILRAAATDHPEWRPLLAGLPVAAFSGTLVTRDLDAAGRAAAGIVHAKTGNISGVTAVAGTVVDAHGRLLVFAFVTDNAIGLTASERALDGLTAALVGL